MILPTVIALGLALAVTLVVSLVSRDGLPGSGRSGAFTTGAGGLKIVASFYPLAYFAERIAGEGGQVVNMVPQGTSAHDWEPKTSDIQLLSQADLFIYNGAGFEPWVEQTLAVLDNDRLVAVNTSDGLELRHYNEDADHDHSGVDPHVWLDPVSAQHQVRTITQALVQVDPGRRQVYEGNAAGLLAQLEQLDQEFAELGTCRHRVVIVPHDYIGYIADRYGFATIPVMGLAPDSEPTPGQLAAVMNFMKDHGIEYIFDEPLVNNRAIQIIAGETGASILTLNPLEGLAQDELAQGADYLTVMRDNLAHLRLALGCD